MTGLTRRSFVAAAGAAATTTNVTRGYAQARETITFAAGLFA